MDTVVRTRDRIWFRVTDIKGDLAELTKLNYGETGFRTGDSEVLKIHLAELEKNYERKNYPKVECYNIYDQKQEEEQEEEPMAEVISGADKTAAPTKTTCVGVADAYPGPEVYTVKRKYVQHIDKILEAVNVSEASDEELITVKELLTQILIRGIQEEIDNEIQTRR